MNDVAIYKEARSNGDLDDIITVFSFTEIAHIAVENAIAAGNFQLVSVAGGNKPNSLKQKIKTTKEEFNKVLEQGA